MIDMKKLKNRKNVSTQTGFTSEFCIYLTNTKKARLYFSESYKDLVLCFSSGESKKIIVTRSMWNIFRKYIIQIDNEFNQRKFCGPNNI